MISAHAAPKEGAVPRMETVRVIAEKACPARPFDRCRAISERLVRDLSKAGIASDVVRRCGHRTERPHADRRWLRIDRSGWIHYAVHVRELDVIVDATWRQFDAHGPSVLILPASEYDHLWTPEEPA